MAFRARLQGKAGDPLKINRNARSTFCGLTLCVALAWLLLGAAGAAVPIPGADIASVRIWLHPNNPRLRAMQADADAADARIHPAGALPDPMASVELDDIDPDRPSLLPSKVGVTTYRLKQQFPLWGKRELSPNVARFEAE